MERLRKGDRICVVHKGQKEEQICTILDILEDYDGSMLWLENERGTLRLEIETPTTTFEKVRINKNQEKTQVLIK